MERSTTLPNPAFTGTDTFTYTAVDGAGHTYTQTVTVEVNAAPSMRITKTVTGTTDVNNNGLVDAGDIVNYRFEVANTGSFDITDITLVDADAILSGGPIASLPIGDTDTDTFTATHELTQVEVNAGIVNNSATASGSSAGGPVTDVSDSGDESTDGPDADSDPTNDPTPFVIAVQGALTAVKSIPMVEDVNDNGVTDEGDIIHYGFTITNATNVPLTTVGVTDANVTMTGAAITLQPGTVDTESFSATHVLTQEDIDSGSFSNQATITGTKPGGGTMVVPTATPTDPTQTVDPDTNPVIPGATVLPIPEAPALSAIKSISEVEDVNDNGVTDEGDIIHYAFSVQNTGNVTLHDVTLTDGDAEVSGGPIALMAPGAVDTTTFTATHALTLADVNGGSYENQATVAGLTPTDKETSTTTKTPTDPTLPVDPTNPVITGPTVLPIAEAPGLDAVKSIERIADTNSNGVTDEGDIIHYLFSVTNTGNVTLHDVRLTDPNAVVAGGPISLLDPGDTDDTTFTATHALTLADINGGSYENQATVAGLTPTDLETSTETKTPTDPTLPVDPTNPIIPGQTVLPLAEAPELTLVKSIDRVDDANANGVTDSGDVIHYAFEVKNVGNVTLHDVTLADLDAAVSGGPILELNPGDVDAVTFTALHTLIQDDIDAGRFANRATVTGLTPSDLETSAQSSTPTDPTQPVDPDTNPLLPEATVLPIAEAPALSAVKSISEIEDVNANNMTDEGDVIHYRFEVRNTGNVTLHDADLTDGDAVVLGGPIAELIPGQVDSSTFIASHALTLAEVNSGTYENQATVTGLTPTDKDTSTTTKTPTDPTLPVDPTNPVITGPTVLPIAEAPALTAVKWIHAVDDTNDNGMTDEGDVVHYRFSVTNTGNVTLHDVTLADDDAVVAGGPIDFLDPSATDSTTFTATHALTLADLNAGSYANQATVRGLTPTDKETSTTTTTPTDPTRPVDPTNPAVPGPTVLPLAETPGLVLVKWIDEVVDTNTNNVTDAGDVVHYAFSVTNTGNVTLAPVTLTDGDADVAGGPIVSLDPGDVDTTTFTATHTLAQIDLDNGLFENQALATGVTPTDLETTAESTTPTDPTTPPGPTNPVVPGKTVLPIGETPAITAVKWISGVDDVNDNGVTDKGDVIRYSFIVTNTGNVTLSQVRIADDDAVATGGLIPSMAPGQSDTGTFSASHVLEQDEVDLGSYANQATFTGDRPGGGTAEASTSTPTDPMSAPDPDTNPVLPGATVLPIPEAPGLSAVKSISEMVDANDNGVTDVGDVIRYAFSVTNTGNVTLTNVEVTDGGAVVSGLRLDPLGPGDTDDTTFTAEHELTLAEVNSGTYENQATVSGVTPTDKQTSTQTKTPTDPTLPVDPTNPVIPAPTVLPLMETPGLSAVKSISGVVDTNDNGVTDASDVIRYAFTVTNTGNVTLAPVTLTDNGAVVSGGPIESLDPGDTDDTTFTAEHELTLADVNSGAYENQATVTGVTPTDKETSTETTTPTDPTLPVDPTNPVIPGPTVLPIVEAPGLSAVKSISEIVDTNDNGLTDEGDVIRYAFTVTNTGNVTLAPVTLTDNGAVVSGGPIESLDPGDTDDTTFIAEHELTLAEVNSGAYENQATVAGVTPTDKSTSTVTTTPTDPTAPVDPTNPVIPGPTVLPIAEHGVLFAVKSISEIVDTNDNGVTDAGDVIRYAFSVSNLGNVTLAPVTLTDNDAVASGGPIESLDPGMTDDTTFTAEHELTLDDMNAGRFENQATVTGTTPGGTPVSTDTSTPTNPVLPVDPTNPVIPGPTVLSLVEAPGLSAVKSISEIVDTNDNGVTDAGDVIRYAFAVSNLGNVTLAPVTLTDIGAVVSGGPIESLDPGDTDDTTFTAEHVLTLAEVNSGTYENQATVTGVTPTDKETSTETKTPTDPTVPVDPTNPVIPGPTVLPIVEAPGLSAVKSISEIVDTNDNGVTDTGDVIRYAFSVTNTGNVTLAPVSLTDNGAVVSGGPIASLDPGITDDTTFTAEHVLTLADVDSGMYENQATVTGVTPTDKETSTETRTPTDPTVPVDPTNPVIPGPTVLPIVEAPGIAAVKSIASITDANANSVTDAGDVINYVFAVTNTGNVTLTQITVTDLAATVGDKTIAVLVPGATDSTTLTAIHTLTLADVNAGRFENRATVTGTAPSGETVSAQTSTPTDPTLPVDPSNPVIPGPTVLPVAEAPRLSVVKTATALNDLDSSDGSSVGDTIQFSIVVTNIGNVTLTQVTVVEELAGATTPACTPAAPATLNPQTAMTCTTVYTMTAIDVEAGEVTNTVRATGMTPKGITTEPERGTAVAKLDPSGVDDTGQTAAGTTLRGTSVLGNDTGIGLRVTSFDATSARGGSVTVNPDGTYTYVPASGFSGTDTFTYTATDANGATYTQTVTITVTPNGTTDAASTTVGTVVSVPVLRNDRGTELEVTEVTDGVHGTVTMNPDGTVTYVPEDGFSGTDTFTYTATDSAGRSYTQTVTVRVAPDGSDDTESTTAGTPVTVPVLDNDNGTALRVTGATNGAHGTVVVNPDGTVRYTPATGFSGTDTFTYTAIDAAGQTYTRTVTVTVTPGGSPDAAKTPAGTAVAIDVLTNDKGTGLTVTSVGKPGHGTAVIGRDGKVVYTPAPGFSGTDTFAYTAVDGEGNEYTETVTVTVAPSSEPDKGTTDPRTPIAIEVLKNDGGKDLAVTSVTQPPRGKVTINPDGTLTYTPDACASEATDCFAGKVTFTYTAVDADGTTYTQTVTVDVTPLGRDDSATTKPGGTVVIDVLDNDETGKSLKVTEVTKPSHGVATIRPDGTIAYTPEPGFTGTDTFTYIACDADGQCVTKTVTVEVEGEITEPTTTTTTTAAPSTTPPPAAPPTSFGEPKPTSTVTSPPAAAPADSPDALSSTGAAVTLALVLGVVALLSGALLMLLAKGRRRH
jgi:uncharacterized repeat protein (TIGR01451 family)